MICCLWWSLRSSQRICLLYTYRKEEESMKDAYEKPILVKHEPLRDVTSSGTNEIAPE